MAISFVGVRPDVLMLAPAFLAEEADEITEELIAFFGLLRPDRLVVMWPNVVVDDGGEPQLGVRVNAAQPGRAGWTWTTRVLGYRCVRRRVVAWDDPVELQADQLDPWSRRLRTLYDDATHRRLLRKGLLEVRHDGGWAVLTHPDSTTFDGLERLGDGRRPGAPRPPGARRPRSRPQGRRSATRRRPSKRRHR